MRDIQQDSVDTNGRRSVPNMILVAETVKQYYSEEEQNDIDEMISWLTGWNGEMGKESVGATVYQVHQSELAHTMFGVWSEVSEHDRCKLFEGHYRMFTFEMLDRMLRLALEQGEYPYNPVCKVPGREY